MLLLSDCPDFKYVFLHLPLGGSVAQSLWNMAKLSTFLLVRGVNQTNLAFCVLIYNSRRVGGASIKSRLLYPSYLTIVCI